MSEREEFVELLIRLVLDGALTEDEAFELLQEYDRTGDLPLGWQLPLPLVEAVLRLTPEILRQAPRVRGDEATLERLQSLFMADVEALAPLFASGDITLKRWQERMMDRLNGYLTAAAQVGAGGVIRSDQEQPIIDRMMVQMAFLSRFADTMAMGEMSEAQVAARSKLYAGEGRALFYEQQEVDSDEQFGWVVDYIAVDDRYTCTPCRQAEEAGPYLPTAGPMPGSICLGRGYCRCRRVLRYAPDVYIRLAGLQVTA